MGEFCCHDHKDIIQKAAKKRPKWSATRNPKRLEALAKRMGNAMAVDIVKGINTFRRKINPQKVYDSWIQNGYEGITHTIPWDKMDEDLTPAKRKVADGLDIFGRLGLEAIAAPQRPKLRYDYKNPNIQRIYEKRSGEWITRINLQTRENIKRIVHTQMTNATSPRDMAAEIRNHVGLTERYSIAHTNYVNGLKEKGVPAEKIDVLGEKYYQKLLTSRARMIARTETQFMLNRGQLEVWKEGQRQGLIPNTAMKVWVADGDPCPDCEAMDGEAVPVHDSWETPDGDEVDIPTEIHPNCNCIMTLEMGDDEEE